MYEQFESGELNELDFLIAERVGMTVAELDQRMSHREFVQWYVYIGRQQQRKELARGGGRGGTG